MKNVLIGSEAEERVVVLVCQGLSNSEVALKLGITENGVKWHLTNVYKRNKVTSRAQLILKMLTPTKLEKAPTLPAKKAVA